MYCGQYRHQLDEKDRFRIPPKLKNKLGEKIYLTSGSRGCLLVFSETDFAVLEEKVKNVPLSDVAAQVPLRALFGNADDPEGDNQGRYRLAPFLKEFAGIDKNVVFVGAGPRLELWSEEGWNAYNDQRVKNSGGFDNALAALKEFGI